MTTALSRKDLLATVAAPLWPLALHAHAGPALRILAYHRIFEMGDEDRFAFDPELVSATREDFRWQMEWIAKHLQPMSLEDVVRAMADGKALPPRAVVVTFDDGHRDNFTHAFPILRAAGVPATIFLSTSYIGGTGTFWFDEVAYRFHETRVSEFRIAALGLAFTPTDVASRREAKDEALRAMKRVPDATRHEALAQLHAATEVDVPTSEASGAMTWDDVRAMTRGGVSFGSHTVSHPILSRLDDEALRRELRDSRAAIARELGEAPATLAYPVGGADEYDARVLRMAREEGYAMGLTYESGTNPWPLPDAYLLRRLHVERYTGRERFAAMLAMPRVFA